jgi:hypothetical protein
MMREVFPQQSNGGNQEAVMAAQSSIVAEPNQELIPPARVGPEVALMGMAREGLQDLNEVVKALAQGELQATGTDTHLHNLSGQIINAAAHCKVGADGVDGLVLAGALFELERVIRKSGRIDETGNIAFTTMREFLEQIASGLKNVETANLETLYASQREAKHAVEEYLNQLKEQGLPVRCDEPKTVLYRELYGTEERRRENAAPFEELASRLLKVAVDADATETLAHLCRDAYAALCAVRSSVKTGSQLKDALKSVLSTSVKLRKAGFDAALLDEAIQESVAGLFAAHVGVEGRLVKPERSLVDRLFGVSRRRSEKAFVAAFGDDPALRESVQYVARCFDLEVVTPEETCKSNIEWLRSAAMKQLSWVHNWSDYAQEWDRSVEHNPWIVEGKRLGLGIAELPLAAERVMTIGDDWVVRRIVEFEGKELEILLTSEIGRSPEEQVAHAKELGYRIATRKEHRAFIQGLLDARKVGALSEAEAAALGTYEDCRVGDDQGALVVWLGGVRTDDDFLQERTRLALYVRELGQSK